MPDGLAPPDLLDGYGGWYEDFWRLSTDRQIGMVEGELPASIIAAHTTGWHYEDADTFEFCMRQMDRIYLRRGEPAEEEEPQVSPRDAFRSATANRRKG